MIPEIKKILFTTDLAPNAKIPFNYAISLAIRYGSLITILHVIEELASDAPAQLKDVLGEDRYKELRDYQQREARKILIGKKTEVMKIKESLHKIFEETDKSMLEDIVVKNGSITECICYEADTRNIDLIIMGYHERGRMEETLVGSTVRKVLRSCKIPVMLIQIPKQ